MSILRKAVIAALFSSVATTAMAAAHSTFQNSCRNIELLFSNDGAWIEAECRTRRGSYKHASFELRGLVNQDGRLRFSGGGAASFQRSCRNLELVWSTEKFSLRGICRKASGDEVRATMAIGSLTNDDGRIVVRR